MKKPRRGNDGHPRNAEIQDKSGDREISEGEKPLKAPPSLRMACLALLVAELTVAGASAAHARRFEFDQRRTEVRFAYKMAYATHRGRFTKVSGTLDFDEAAPGKSKVNASISAASLTTGEDFIDNELRGADFFNVERSPVIAFKSVGVRTGSQTAAEVLGEITVNGITKPVTLQVSIESHDDPALKYDAGARRFIAKTRIQRSAFNMTNYQAMVDDDVDIEIDAIVRPR
ncbi:YceI family protein [Hyphomicrobium sp. ghe19]|uniref:YceI family protein n=1 Tax=Hyphomicrobium sp. ghe19 TaxID=2682968 RepID=UPI001366F9C5|nr:Protein YceI [Hyphomicrobium sp. ghe19]